MRCGLRFAGAVLAAILATQVIAWLAVGRSSLVRASPIAFAATHRSGIEYFRELGIPPDHPLPHFNLIICEALASKLGADAKSLHGNAFSGFDVSILFESEAPSPETMEGWRALQDGRYQRFCAEPDLNLPLLGRLKVVSGWGGTSGSGFDSWFVFVLGKWIHVRSHMTWRA